MSFTIDWNSFNDENFYCKAKALLMNALNKSDRPSILADQIEVSDLSLGKEPPQLEILEIGDLADDRFRGIFKLNYNGDASMTLRTKIQANPLNVYCQNSPSFCRPKFIGASSSLAIPLHLTLSQIRLSGIIILVFSKAKGLTLVFRNDPLVSIRVTSTFDGVPGIARFIQVQIENLIRDLFREELPAILHRLSHRWTPSGIISPAPNSPKLKPISLMEINPFLPALSPSNMLKIDTLCASQKTLSLFTPSIPEAVFRSNIDTFNQTDFDIQTVKGDDLTEIVRIQSRNYFRNSHTKPKRRVLKLKKSFSSKVTTSSTSSTVASTVASTFTSSATSTDSAASICLTFPTTPITRSFDSPPTSFISENDFSSNTNTSLSSHSSPISSPLTSPTYSSETDLSFVYTSHASQNEIPLLDLNSISTKADAKVLALDQLPSPSMERPSTARSAGTNMFNKDKKESLRDFFSANVAIRSDDGNFPPPPAYVA